MFELALLLAFIPLLGVVVRYRATYHPKLKASKAGSTFCQLSSTPTPIAATFVNNEHDEKDVNPPTTSNMDGLQEEKDGQVKIDLGVDTVPESTPTFTGVWRNVWREEKIEGLFKGIFPGFMFSLVIFLRGFVSPAPAIFMRNYKTVVPVNILYLPYMVATYRIIVTPHKSRVWEPKEMYRRLFSDYERQNRFLAIRYSPVILPFITALLFDFFFVRGVRDLMGDVNSPIGDFEVEPDAVWQDNVRKGLHHILWWEVGRILRYPLFAVFCTLVMTPVDVIVTRLAIQPVHAPPRSEPMEERDVEKMEDNAAPCPPSYLRLTTEQPPYAGFVDCFKRIVEEEGWSVLYRTWILTFVGYLVPPLR